MAFTEDDDKAHGQIDMKLSISFKPTGIGWADFHVADETSSCTVTASYISDALRYLVLAATAVLSGFKSATFSFDDEPGEIRWVISSPRMNEIELTILQFPELWGGKPDAEGTPRFRTRCRPRTFAEAVNTAATESSTELVNVVTRSNGWNIRFQRFSFRSCSGSWHSIKRLYEVGGTCAQAFDPSLLQRD